MTRAAQGPSVSVGLVCVTGSPGSLTAFRGEQTDLDVTRASREAALVAHQGRHMAVKRIERWDLAPAAARVRGDEGNRRLHHRWVKLIDRHTRSTVANVAIARELAGRCRSLAVMEDPHSCFAAHIRLVAARGATRDPAVSSRPGGDARP